MNTPTPTTTPRTDALRQAMTKDSIDKIIAHNRRPFAVHQMWAQFDQMQRTLTAERDAARARAERAEAEVKRLRSDRDCEKRLRKDADEFREDAIERAMKAEDNLAALEQCHDDNCRGVVRIAADLAAERARLDWVFTNCKVTGDDYWIHDREDLGAAMKEDAK